MILKGKLIAVEEGVKQPGSSTLYYMFTTNIQAGNTLKLEYHVVDMQLNGGLGDVESKNNILSSLVITEQVAATWHSNGQDIWIVTHEYGSNQFLAFLLTASGISSTPIISAVGPSHVACTSSFNARGEIKFSPNGGKVAMNGNGVGNNDTTNLLSLFDFNTTNGQVSNPIDLPFSRGEFALSFSPDNSKLYGATWKAFNFTATDSNYLYQFDLSGGTAASIINSKVLIDSGGKFGTMQLAPDGKIYVRRPNSKYLGIIHQPNTAGLLCNYQKDGFDLGVSMAQYGLNHYIEYTSYCASSSTDNVSYVQQDGLELYPIPTSSNLKVTWNEAFGYANIQLLDMQGRVVLDKSEIATSEVSLDVSNVRSGAYTIILWRRGAVVARKKCL